MNGLTVVSLFDGIGGFPLAFQRAGATTVATVEIDEKAAAISKRHFPDAQQFTDVTEVTGDQLRGAGFVPNRGVLTAGWPCQDLSVAGLRAGLAGARSGLWWEVVRLLDETRPRWFLGENVPGLLSSNNGRDFGAVVGSLADLGFSVAWRVLDASKFGVPQRRRRVFIVGHSGTSDTAPVEVLFEPESGGGDSAAGGEAGPGVASSVADCARNASGGGLMPTLTARYHKSQTPFDDGLVIDNTHTHTHLDSSGRRETRLPDRRRIGGGRASGRRETVTAMTTSYGGIGGVDDNAAQAGYVVAQQVETTIGGGSCIP